MSQSPRKSFFTPTDPNDWRVSLDPDEPGITPAMRASRLALIELENMSPEEVFQIAVRAGISTPDGQLTEYYRSDDATVPGPLEPARCPHCNGVIS